LGYKQDVALTGRNHTVPTGRPPTRVTDDDRQQTTDAREQNNTGPLGWPLWPVINKYQTFKINYKQFI